MTALISGARPTIAGTVFGNPVAEATREVLLRMVAEGHAESYVHCALRAPESRSCFDIGQKMKCLSPTTLNSLDLCSYGKF